MADYSQGAPPPPPMGGLHSGRIPSFRNNHGDNFQMCGPEPPACVQNAMMTKDKKPFTYTPGGLDLSQIRTPSMARRLNKQQQHQEDLENPAYFRQPSVNGGPSVPAPPPPPPPGPPPPPPLVISVNKPNKAVNDGERPEIVIPENPIGMLRKTHSPYHWESEESNRLQQGSIPKFIEKSATPSPVAPQMRRPPPQQFSQQAPQPSPPHFNQQPPQFNQQPPQFNQQPTQQFSPQLSQQSPQTYGHQQPSPQISSRYENNLPQQNNKSGAESPIWKPEPKYPNSPKPNNVYSPVPNAQQNQTPTKDTLQRQDSQFNLSPSPWGKESPFSNASSTTSSSNNQTLSPSCDTSSSVRSTPVSSASPWKQEVRGSPMQNNVKSPVQSPYNDGYRVTPIHIEARDMQVNPNSPAQSVRSPNQSPYVEVQQSSQNAPPWRQQQAGTPNVQPMSPVNNVRVINQNQPRSPTYVQSPSSAYIVKSPSPPKNNNVYSNMQPESDEVRYQSHMTIPVTPRKTRNEDIQEQPVLKLVESPKENLPWVRGQNTVNKAVPPPPWCQRSESRKSLPRDSFDQNDGESPQTPWGQRTLDNRKSLPKEPPQSSEPQPPWVTENRRYETLPRAQPGKVSSISTPTGQIIQHVRSCDSPGRVIPIQMEVTKQDNSQNNNSGNAQIKQGPQGRNQQQPQLRIIIDMNQQGQRGQPAQGGPNISFQQTQPQMQQNKPNVSMQQPQQHISRVLTPQLMKMEGATVGSPLRQEPSPNFQQQPKTRIIPIQMEPSSPVVTSPSRRN